MGNSHSIIKLFCLNQLIIRGSQWIVHYALEIYFILTHTGHVHACIARVARVDTVQCTMYIHARTHACTHSLIQCLMQSSLPLFRANMLTTDGMNVDVLNDDVDVDVDVNVNVGVSLSVIIVDIPMK